MLLRQTILYLPAQIVGPLAQFLSVILWTYFLSPEEMGTFALITAAQELAYTAVVFWFTLYTVRYFDKTSTAADKNTFLDTERGVLLAASFVTALGMLVMPLFSDERLGSQSCFCRRRLQRLEVGCNASRGSGAHGRRCDYVFDPAGPLARCRAGIRIAVRRDLFADSGNSALGLHRRANRDVRAGVLTARIWQNRSTFPDR